MTSVASSWLSELQESLGLDVPFQTEQVRVEVSGSLREKFAWNSRELPWKTLSCLE